MKSEQPIYLNHAGTSWPKPPPVLEAAHSVLYSDPTNWRQLFDAAHHKVADFFRVDAARLLLTPRCTSDQAK
jgi:selenocysteine lyase/cysteine desulfurase